MTTATAEQQWRARPVVATVLRCVLFAVPLLASSAVVYGLARWLPSGAARSWWGIAALLLTGLVAAMAVERAARRLLPIALLLQLSLIFPDRAPSRLRIARDAAVRRPRNELLWTGSGLAPTSTADLVLALVSALGAHDRRTRGHSERVRLLCDMLGAELKLDDDARDRLRWAALLHDVGKVEVSSRILNKPAKLTAAEFAEVTLHPQAGATLAAPLLPWLGEWGDGILDHHERYDGTGYPNGKAGEQISPAGRLIAVIDAFETMTAARPYKKAMAARAARAELARCAGAHFDPVYVRAFLAISLPRLLWAMGPLSFLLQLPFLQPLAQTGARVSAAGPQTAGAVAAAAGAAALATSGAATPAASPAPEQTVAAAVPVQQQDSRLDRATVEAPRRNAPAAPTAASSSPQAPGAVGTTASAAPSTAVAPSAPRPAAGGPSPAPVTASPQPPAAQPAPEAENRVDEEHRAILSGPPAETSSRRATFELAPGTDWECQLMGAADGSPSRWEPCSGTFTITVVRDGDHTLRVREAATRDAVDAWEWTVTPSARPPAGDRAPEAR